MSRVLLVLIAAVALAGAVVWFATATPPRGTRAPEPAAPVAAVEREPSAPVTAPAAQETEAAEPAASGSHREAADSKEAELARAQWIDGRVLFPAGTPDDEQVFVRADGRKFEDGSHHRVAVARDGTFRVAFSEKTRSGRFVLEARYLYLDEVVRWKRGESDGTVVLAPKLGARIAGRVRLPAGADGARVGGKLELFASRHTDKFLGDEHRRVLELARGGDFAFDGLVPAAPPEQTYLVSYDGAAYLGQSGRLAPEAGKTLPLELELRPGLVLAGVVRDENGKPIEGAQLDAFVDSGSRAARDATSAADGTFRLGALSGGEVHLRARHTGYEPLEQALGKHEEGESVRDLVLVLASGGSIAGIVRWPDGSPAEATLVLTARGQDRQWEADEIDGKSDANGAFLISGLSEETYRVRARATKTEEALVESGGKPRKKKERTEWSAEADAVRAGTQALVLTLSTGLTLEGRVVDDLGAPLEDFEVQAHRAGSESSANLSRPFRGTDGSFRMNGFAEGAWAVSGRSKGHAPSERVSVVLPGNEPILLVVPRESVVRGRVLDPGGAPVAGASLEVRRGKDSSSSSGVGGQERSGEDGAFALDGLGPGTLVLQATSATFAPSERAVLELVAGEERSDVVLQLRPGGTILGELFGADGRPQAGQEVVISDHRGFYSNVETDDQGRFQASGLPPGELFLWANTPEGVQLQERVRLSAGETVRVRLAPPGRLVGLHGHVRAGGEPLASAHLWAMRAGEGDGPSGGSSTTDTDEDGYYELQLPGAGAYWLQVQGDGDASLSWSAKLDAPAVDALEFDVAVPVGRISGRVTDADGRALAGILVASVPERHEGGAHGSAHARTDDDGRYELLVPAGQHAVEAGGGEDSEAGRPSPYARTRIGNLFVAENDHLRGIDLRLDAGGILEGVVRAADGSSPGRVWIWAEAPQQIALSDDGGRFRMRLPAGSYQVGSSAGNDSACTPVRVEVASGETRQVELTLAPARRVLLSILQRGTPVGCELRVLDARGQEQRAQTRENGKFWLGPLVPGSYTARAQRDGKEVRRAFEVEAGGEEMRLELVFE